MNSIAIHCLKGCGIITILIDNTTVEPIYEQILSQIKDSILSGELKADAPLPSIRGLAKELKVSVITTKRAYDELENQGYICTVAGKGCFVSPKSKHIADEEIKNQITANLENVNRLCNMSVYNKKDIIAMLDSFEWSE